MKTKIRLASAFGAAMIAAAVIPFAASGTAVAAPGDEDCPAGTTAVAKYEWKGDGYEADFGGDVVTVTGDTSGGTFTSTVPISDVFVKGATDGNLIEFDPPVLAGAFTNAGLTNPGGTPAISHVTFCTGGPTTPPSTPATTPPATTPAATTPPASVAPTTAAASPSTSVKAAKNAKPPAVLPKTGSGMSLGTGLAISLGLLLGGAALMFGSSRVALAKGKRRH
jgi:hypothetical protein